MELLARKDKWEKALLCFAAEFLVQEGQDHGPVLAVEGFEEAEAAGAAVENLEVFATVGPKGLAGETGHVGGMGAEGIGDSACLGGQARCVQSHLKALAEVRGILEHLRHLWEHMGD